MSKYRKSSIKSPLSIKPPLFRGGKLISPPPSLLPPPPQSLFFAQKLTINVDWSVMVYSGWKFILFLVFGRMTSNFICLTFTTLRSSSLWRIGTIFLSLDKTVYRPGTTSPSSRNLALVGENSKLQPSRDKNLHITFIKKAGSKYSAKTHVQAWYARRSKAVWWIFSWHLPPVYQQLSRSRTSWTFAYRIIISASRAGQRILPELLPF